MQITLLCLFFASGFIETNAFKVSPRIPTRIQASQRARSFSLSPCTQRIPASSSTIQYMFDFFKKSSPSKDNNTPTVTKPNSKAPSSTKNGKLEKISFKQNRDYNAEALAKEPPKPVIKDMQPSSYNFNKANEFPNLYKGWIKKDGDQICKQMVAATKAAITKGKEKYIELLIDPVPNLDEVAFGTEWNQKFRKELAAELKVPDYATNRGGPATLEWSNIYWAKRVIDGANLKSGNKKVVVLSISGTGMRGEFVPDLGKNVELIRFSDAKKKGYLETVVLGSSAAADSNKAGSALPISAFVVLSPCQESHYGDAKKLGDLYGAPVIALNSPYSYRYDIGAGAPWSLAYVMKRIPKGWIFGHYGKPFEAVIEGPNYEMFKAKTTFYKQPSLPEFSKVSMQASADRFGAAGNDRIFQNRL